MMWWATAALVDSAYIAAVGYVCVLAIDPTVANRAPAALRWFGAPGSHATIAVILALPVVHFVLRRLSGHELVSGTPLVVIAAMAASTVALGLSAYWRCHGDQAPFFSPLSWTLSLFLGSVENPFGAGGTGRCATMHMPVALEIARLLAIATTLAAAMAAAIALFRAQFDRLAIWRARLLTVVVDIDDETVSMVRAISRTRDPAASLVVLTEDIERDAARAVRRLGARLRSVDFADTDALALLPLWNRIDRLYLLSADPMQNVARFSAIDAALRGRDNRQRRIPLTVRIDDPWQAEVWRRALASTERHWVADAVGRNEVTAAKLVRHLTMRRGDGLNPPGTVVLCGLNPLTYALASEFAQVHRELGLYAKPAVLSPESVVIFACGASSFIDDHRIRQDRIAPDGTALPVLAHEEDPTVDAITRYLQNADTGECAIILGDPRMDTLGTRLASRFPGLRVYLASATSTALADISIVGQLYSFPINMELDPDAPQDVWERAAELVHEHYSSGTARTTPATKPWKELDPLFKQSNRRQLVNALWMVEALAGHSWNSLEEPPPAASLPAEFASLPPLSQLDVLGFDRAAVEAMVRTEHEDWRRHYEAAGWRYAVSRDDDALRHDKLLPWDELVARNPASVHDAYRSLASTLINLRNLGYRSVPKKQNAGWRRYRRLGEVFAEQRSHPWTWTAPSGEVMQARAGDWAVVDDSGDERSVAAEVFGSTHESIGAGRYRRTGTVLARPAIPGEVISTLEGDVVADEHDWVLQGAGGEQWPVPDAQFRASYTAVDDA
ncbi:hypothetical protein ASG82_18185 [Mycobacterium sp. Soil538]|nr:hypothetical protein ASG82_18185 [Mycobacterium sp. Soil538]